MSDDSIRDKAIRDLAYAFKAMTLEEVERFAVMVMEPAPMEHDEIVSLVLTAQSELVQRHGIRSDLANFAGTLTRDALWNIQDEDIMIEDIMVHQRTIRPGMRPKIIVRTVPVGGVRWFASIDTWREGDR